MSLTEKRKPDQSIDEETLSPAPKRRRNEEDLSSYSETENLQNRGSGVPENVSGETKSIVVLPGKTVVPEIDGQLTKDPTEAAKVEIQPLSTTTISDLNSVDLDIKPEIKQNKTDEDNSQSRSGPKFKYSRLYRLLRRNEDPKTDGIRAKLPDARVTIHDHVSVGSSHGSQYISTAASWGAIIAFARNKKWFPKIITTIDVEKLENVSGIQLIDLTDATKREANLHDQRAKNPARKYEEVLITGEIPSHCIIETTALLEPEPDSDSDFDTDFDSSDNDWY